MVELIHADRYLNELGLITDFTRFDSVVALADQSSASDWALELPAEVWRDDPIVCGDYVYIDRSEWGGPVEQVKHTAADGMVRLSGPNWRALLERKVVAPREGETHVILPLSTPSAMLQNLTSGWMPGLLRILPDSGAEVLSGAIRYRTMLKAAEELLEGIGCRLSVKFADKKIAVGCEKMRDFSANTEFSSDYEANLTTDIRGERYNHIIALGSGEMLARTVVELWRLPDGSITENKNAAGVPSAADIRTLLYDYPGAESAADLRLLAKAKLRDAGAGFGLEIDLSDLEDELELTDVVAVRDTLTGVSSALRVVSKNLSISESEACVRHVLK